MFRSKPLTLAMRCALSGAAVTSTMMAPVVFSQENVAEEIVVTGSRIVRSNYPEGSQVVNIDQAAIDATGSLMIADVVRSSPLNAYGSFNERSGSSAQSNATINLRGLGSQRTLVMLDGRRMVGSPNLGAASTNINMIPMTAVRSIDVLADGASAVYGSDAVAGVVNMQLWDDYEGLEISTRYGDRDRDDGSEASLSMLAGFSGDRGNITVALETDRRDPIFDRDREYMVSWIRDTNNNGIIEADLDTNGYSIYGKTVSIYDPNTGLDRALASTNCADAGPSFIEVNADVSWGSLSGDTGNTYCMYDYSQVTANKAELDRQSAYVNVNYDIADNVEFYGRTIISRVESFGRYAPPAAPWSDMPADYVDVPFDIDAMLASGEITEDYSLTGYYRWSNVGNRDNFVTDTQYDYVAGFRGEWIPGIDFDGYVQHSRYDSEEFGKYYLSIPGLNSTLDAGIDPFSEAGAAAMSALTSQDNVSEMSKGYIDAQFSLGSFLPGGESLMLVGGEYMDFNFENLYDRLSEAGLVGGSAGNSASGQRHVWALFAETVLPVTDTLELNVAARYDEYSDFGEAFSPSISATWAVADSLTLRGRWGQGFRAPALDELYGALAFSAEFASDQLNCMNSGIAPVDCPQGQTDTYFDSNPNLDAEESTSWSVGANWVATDWLTLDIGYWDVEIDDVITQPGSQSLFFAEVAGVALDPATGTYVDRSGGRPILYSTYVNQGTLAATGVDLQVNLGFETEAGYFYINSLISHSLDYEQSAYFGGAEQDTAGFNLQPELKGQTALGWELGGHAIDLVWDYVGPSSKQDFIDFVDPNDPSTAFLNTSDSEFKQWSTLNASYSYASDTYGTFKVGGRNITDEDPVLDRNGMFDPSHYDLYDQTGRVYYVEYTKQF